MKRKKLSASRMPENRMEIAALVMPKATPSWFSRLTAAGFLFFLAKGLLWIALGLWFARF